MNKDYTSDFVRYNVLAHIMDFTTTDDLGKHLLSITSLNPSGVEEGIRVIVQSGGFLQTTHDKRNFLNDIFQVTPFDDHMSDEEVDKNYEDIISREAQRIVDEYTRYDSILKIARYIHSLKRFSVNANPKLQNFSKIKTA